MNMIFYKMFTDWNGIFESLPDESAGKLIKVIAFFTDDLRKNQTLEADPDERAQGAIIKATITEPILLGLANMCCSRLYSEYVSAMGKSETNRTNGGKGGNKKHHNELFAELWELYPKKAGEEKAREVFAALDPDAELFACIKEGVERCKRSEQWQEARYIPELANWLTDKRWTDDLPKPTGKKKTNPALAYEQKPISEADFNANIVNLDDYSDGNS